MHESKIGSMALGPLGARRNQFWHQQERWGTQAWASGTKLVFPTFASAGARTDSFALPMVPMPCSRWFPRRCQALRFHWSQALGTSGGISGMDTSQWGHEFGQHQHQIYLMWINWLLGEGSWCTCLVLSRFQFISSKKSKFTWNWFGASSSINMCVLIHFSSSK